MIQWDKVKFWFLIKRRFMVKEKFLLNNEQRDKLKKIFENSLDYSYEKLQAKMLTTFEAVLDKPKQLISLKKREKDLQTKMRNQIYKGTAALIEKYFAQDKEKKVKKQRVKVKVIKSVSDQKEAQFNKAYIKLIEDFAYSCYLLIEEAFKTMEKRLNNLLSAIIIDSRIKSLQNEVSEILKETKLKLEDFDNTNIIDFFTLPIKG